jgi:hypothetical protein
MKKPNLFLLTIVDFGGESILQKVILSYEDLEDSYYTQFWYLKNYLGIYDEFEIYKANFKQINLEIVGINEEELNLLHAVRALIN